MKINAVTNQITSARAVKRSQRRSLVRTYPTKDTPKVITTSAPKILRTNMVFGCPAVRSGAAKKTNRIGRSPAGSGSLDLQPQESRGLFGSEEADEFPRRGVFHQPAQ